MVVLAYVLIVIGGLGFLARSIEFVRVTIPRNYGSNPGFGAYETMVLPWFALGVIGLGILLGSWKWALLAMVIGVFALGFLAMVLARVFGR